MRWDPDLNPAVCSLRGTILNGFRYRVAAPSIRIVPWAALASCWPLPQQLLPVSTAGGGRRCCTLAIFSGKLFLIRDSEPPAGVSESPFHRWGVKGSSICSTDFCKSAVLRGYPFRHRLRRCHLPQGDGFQRWRESFQHSPKAPPWGSWRVAPEGVGLAITACALSIKAYAFVSSSRFWV